MLLTSIKQLFMGLLFISSKALVLALVCSSWGVWRPGRALSGGERLALAAPWSWSSVWLTCHIPSLVIFSTFHVHVSPLESLSCNLPLSQRSCCFNFTFLISLGLCSTDCFTALLHNFMISSAASAKVMELGCPRPELNHGEGGGVTEGATEQVGYGHPAVPYQK